VLLVQAVAVVVRKVGRLALLVLVVVLPEQITTQNRPALLPTQAAAAVVAVRHQPEVKAATAAAALSFSVLHAQ
jgi:hypothetical protein